MKRVILVFVSVMCAGSMIVGCSDSGASKDSFVDGENVTKPTISGDKAMRDRGMTDEDIQREKSTQNSYGGGPMDKK